MKRPIGLWLIVTLSLSWALWQGFELAKSGLYPDPRRDTWWNYPSVGLLVPTLFIVATSALGVLGLFRAARHFLVFGLLLACAWALWVALSSAETIRSIDPNSLDTQFWFRALAPSVFFLAFAAVATWYLYAKSARYFATRRSRPS